MLYGVVLQNYPVQIVPLIRAGDVPENMREFLSWTHKHYQIDATTSTLQRITIEPSFVCCFVSMWMREALLQRVGRAFRQINMQDS